MLVILGSIARLLEGQGVLQYKACDVRLVCAAVRVLQTGSEVVDGLLLTLAVWWQRTGKGAAKRDLAAFGAKVDRFRQDHPLPPFFRGRGSSPAVLAPRDLRRTPPRAGG